MNQLSPELFGAVGDGRHDDTTALQAALRQMRPGDTLLLRKGRVYRHDATLRVATPEVRVTGGGMLLAGREQDSSVTIAADRVTVEDVSLGVAQTTRRWDAYEQMKLRLDGDGIVVRHVRITGSAAAGIYVGRSSRFTISDVTVANTRADGIHITEASHHGRIIRPWVTNSGDDGVAVVSYRNNSTYVHDVTVASPTVTQQRWGRAYAVVGGCRIQFRNITAINSAAASVYIASERQYRTTGVRDITVNGGTIVGANQQADLAAAARPSPTRPRVVHGAITIYNSQPDRLITDVTVRDVTIRDTNVDAYEPVKLIADRSDAVRRVRLKGLHITGAFGRTVFRSPAGLGL